MKFIRLESDVMGDLTPTECPTLDVAFTGLRFDDDDHRQTVRLRVEAWSVTARPGDVLLLSEGAVLVAAASPPSVHEVRTKTTHIHTIDRVYLGPPTPAAGDDSELDEEEDDPPRRDLTLALEGDDGPEDEEEAPGETRCYPQPAPRKRPAAGGRKRGGKKGRR